MMLPLSAFQILISSCNKLISPLRCLLSHGSNFCCLFLLNAEWLLFDFFCVRVLVFLLLVEGVSCGLFVFV